MAVPTISSLMPTSGLPSGDSLVAIAGTNFNPATIPPTGFPGAAFPQTVRVLFDGIEGTDARCFSSTFVTVLAPPHAAGLVNVTLLNLDQSSGDPIAGEQVVATSAYTYAAPIHTADYEGDLARLVRGMLQLLKREVILEVTHAVQTDYVDPDADDVSLHITKFAKLPGLSLVGPELEENRFYSLNEEPTVEDPSVVDDDGNPINFVRTRVPYTVDVLFTIVGASDSKIELLNLMQNFIAFMHKNKLFTMNKSGTDPSQGTVSYEMDFQPDGQPKARKINVGVESASNIRAFDAAILIRGFDIDTSAGIRAGSTAGVPNQAIVERGNTVEDVIVTSLQNPTD